MKVSVSLPPGDVEFLDGYAHEQGLDSRSAAVHRAVEMLRAAGLSEAYAQAWDEWEATDEGVWEQAAGDGIE